jgi:hypothetical protein
MAKFKPVVLDIDKSPQAFWEHRERQKELNRREDAARRAEAENQSYAKQWFFGTKSLGQIIAESWTSNQARPDKFFIDSHPEARVPAPTVPQPSVELPRPGHKPVYRLQEQARAMAKRKRSSNGSGSKRRKTGPGYTRRIGNYGRYNAPSGIELTKRTSVGPGRELKYFDRHINGQSINSTTGSIMNLTQLLAQGVAPNQRIGRKIKVHRVSARLRVLKSATTVSNPTQTYRVMVVIDRQTNGTQFTIDDLLDDGATTNLTRQFRLLTNSGRFKVLSDKIFTLNHMAPRDTSTSEVAPVATFWQWSANLKGMPIEFDGSTGAVTEVRTNNIYIFYGQGQTDVNHGVSSMSIATRIRYEG